MRSAWVITAIVGGLCGTVGYLNGPAIAASLRTARPRLVAASVAITRRVPRSSRGATPTVSSRLDGPDQIKLSEKPVIRLVIEDIDEYDESEAAPILSYTAKLSCLNCTKIPDNDIKLKGVIRADGDWTVAPIATGSLSIQASVTNDSTGETTSTAKTIDVLDRYGLTEGEHDFASTSFGAIAFIAGAVITAIAGRFFGVGK
jgi:hypothetical protein